jgi:signal transduction histidine kinase
MVVERLFPQAAERDEKFRQELLRQAHQALRLIGGLAVVVPVLLLLARYPLAPEASQAVRLPPAMGVIAAGLLALGVAQTGWSRRHGRALAAASVWLIAAVLVTFLLLVVPRAPASEYRLSGYFTLLMLLAAAAIPMRPVETLGLGVAIEAWFLGCCLAAGGCDPFEHLFVILLSFAAAALTAAAYAHRLAGYRARQQALRANEYLCLAQTRVLLSENAALLGRLAATLVHELNSPLGALSSAVDTLVVLSARQAAARPEDRGRLLALESEVRASIRSSLERLQRTVNRLERLTGLDDAEFRQVDLNDLLRKVSTLVQTQSEQELAVEFDLQPLPPMTCQPQQLSAVFSNLLTNAAKAMGNRGCVRISTRHENSRVEIRIQDCGCGIPADDLEHLFEPGFKVASGRVSTANWSLFSCRQIVQGHGGDIYIASSEGKGSTAVIALPV